MTYTYAGGDPVNRVDPSGLRPVRVETVERATVAASGHVFGTQRLGARGGRVRPMANGDVPTDDTPPVNQDGGNGGYDPARDGPIDERIGVEGRRSGGGVDYGDIRPDQVGPANERPRNADGGAGRGGRPERRQGTGNEAPKTAPYTAADGAKAIGVATAGIKIALDGLGLAIPLTLPFTKPAGWFVGAIGFLWAVGYEPPTFPADSGTLEGP